MFPSSPLGKAEANPSLAWPHQSEITLPSHQSLGATELLLHHSVQLLTHLLPLMLGKKIKSRDLPIIKSFSSTSDIKTELFEKQTFYLEVGFISLWLKL